GQRHARSARQDAGRDGSERRCNAGVARRGAFHEQARGRGQACPYLRELLDARSPAQGHRRHLHDHPHYAEQDRLKHDPRRPQPARARSASMASKAILMLRMKAALYGKSGFSSWTSIEALTSNTTRSPLASSAQSMPKKSRPMRFLIVRNISK